MLLGVMFAGLDMHERQSCTEKQFPHELISFTRFVPSDRLDQLDAKRRLERIGFTQQKIHMLAKKFTEEVDFLVRARDIKNFVQRHLWANQIVMSYHFLQDTQQRQLRRGQKMFTQTIW